MVSESIVKLRDYLRVTVDEPREAYAYLDEIQAEIDERYMELPVDADGVPIHVGDRLDWCDEKIEAKGVCDDSVWFVPYNSDQEWKCIWSNACRHVKQRTLESILCDALADVSCMGDGIVRHFEPDDPYVAELAAEIRELLGGDAE